MGVGYNSKIVRNGLTFLFDETNPRSGISYDLVANRYRYEFFSNESRWSRDALLDTMYGSVAGKDSPAPFPGTGFSVSVWSKKTSADQATWYPMFLMEFSRRMLWLGYTSGNASIIHMSMPYYNSAGVYTYWSIDPPFSATGQTLTIGKWNNFSLTYDNFTRTAKGYINGILGATGTRPGTGDLVLPSDGITAPPLRIIGINGDTTNFHNVSYVACYNRELSSDEVVQNYNNIKGKFGL